jgi:CheY-like chemotaxis protein
VVTAHRVLVVDDNPMNVTIACEVLIADGFEVESAARAVETMQKIDAFRPELILMDIQLPGIDGLELTRQIKSDPTRQHIVVVAFTAFAMRGDEEKMRAAGCDGYVSKPIEVNRFAGQITALLRPQADSGLQVP